jgi:hypothetical protein
MKIKNEHGVEVYPAYSFEGSAIDTADVAIQALDGARDEIVKLFESAPKHLVHIMDSLNQVRNFIELAENKEPVTIGRLADGLNMLDERLNNEPLPDERDWAEVAKRVHYLRNMSLDLERGTGWRRDEVTF